VTKNSGGDATFAKIGAARSLGLPVIMIARPEKPSLATASTVDELSEQIEAEMR
ncbi:MAG: precorrin-6A/cobalt-precorrin-6A reductase, partial [Hyphomicrobiaceae bacterium]|nr:precorrin-6A/cobalt-precorrin-6A reductase [Hyphomicrobiaceae bacterium]